MDSRVDIEGEVLATTDAAVLLRVEVVPGKFQEEWLPKSQLEDDAEDLQKGEIFSTTIPEWLAEDRGLA